MVSPRPRGPFGKGNGRGRVLSVSLLFVLYHSPVSVWKLVMKQGGVVIDDSPRCSVS